MENFAAEPLSPRELLDMEVNALFTHDKNGRVLLLDEPWDGTKPAARFFLGRTTDGKIVRRYRPELPAELMKELEGLCAGEPGAENFTDLPQNTSRYLKLLGGKDFYAGPHWLVPCSEKKDLYRKNWVPGALETIPALITKENIGNFSLEGFEWLKDEIHVAEPCAGLIVEGRLVSLCRSVRISSRAHEAGLETLPDFRGKGYAVTVTLAWAAAVRDLGALPFYSTSRQNVNSQRVAKKLGLYYLGNSFSVQ